MHRISTKPPGSRRRRAVVALTATVIATLALAGTASATTVFDEVWAQIRPLLADAGTINSADNPVDWTKLKSVPAGLADGLDNGVDRAGFGLKKNLYPNVEFAVDRTEIQERVDGTCPNGQAVQSIAEDGTVTCYVGPRAFSASSTNTGIICNDWCVEGDMTLGPGTYAVTAKIVVYQDDYDSSLYKVTCQLRARPEWQEVRVDESEIEPSSNGRNPVTLPLQGVVTLHQQRAGNVMLVCRDYDFGDAKGRMLQMMAISVS